MATAQQLFTDDSDLSAVVKALYTRMRQLYPSIPARVDRARGVSFKRPPTASASASASASAAVDDGAKWRITEGLVGHMVRAVVWCWVLLQQMLIWGVGCGCVAPCGVVWCGGGVWCIASLDQSRAALQSGRNRRLQTARRR